MLLMDLPDWDISDLSIIEIVPLSIMMPPYGNCQHSIQK